MKLKMFKLILGAMTLKMFKLILGAMTLVVIFIAAIHVNNTRRKANLFSSHPNLWVWEHGAYNMKPLWKFNRQTLFGVTLVRNKAVFLAEWLDFHFDQGFDFFFV